MNYKDFNKLADRHWKKRATLRPLKNVPVLGFYPPNNYTIVIRTDSNHFAGKNADKVTHWRKLPLRPYTDAEFNEYLAWKESEKVRRAEERRIEEGRRAQRAEERRIAREKKEAAEAQERAEQQLVVIRKMEEVGEREREREEAKVFNPVLAVKKRKYEKKEKGDVTE